MMKRIFACVGLFLVSGFADTTTLNIKRGLWLSGVPVDTGGYTWHGEARHDYFWGSEMTQTAEDTWDHFLRESSLNAGALVLRSVDSAIGAYSYEYRTNIQDGEFSVLLLHPNGSSYEARLSASDGLYMANDPPQDDPVETYVQYWGISTPSVNTVDLYATSVNAAEVVTTPKWEVIPDYVFDPAYERKSLADIESFVRENRHLPHVPSAEEIADKGMNLTEMNLSLLKTMEEMTLHLIEMDKEIKAQKERNERLEEVIGKLQVVKRGED